MTKKSAAKILLVEDEDTLGSTLQEQLQNDNHDVTWCQNIRRAKEAAALNMFDLAILDVGLPDGTGFELAQHLRSTQHAVGILFLTAWGTPEDRVKGLALGAEDYVVKPFHLQEFLLRVQACLKRARYYTGLSTVDEVNIGRARVCFSKGEAVVDGVTHTLSRKECALLRLLVERRGSAVSRDEVLDEVWSKSEFPTSRTVDNFVLRIRKIVENNPEEPTCIKTIRGVGYSME